MYDKSFYRTSFNDLKKYVKLGVFCDDIGLSRSSLTMFLKGDQFDYYISQEKLDMLYNNISVFFKKTMC